MHTESAPRITLKVINSLYVEAMLLADEARAYFDQHSHPTRAVMAPIDRVNFSCESLKVTARLMHVIAWLLHQRAHAENDRLAPPDRLGDAADSDPAALARLPAEAQQIIAASVGLYARVARLEGRMSAQAFAGPSPALSLQSRLIAAL